MLPLVHLSINTQLHQALGVEKKVVSVDFRRGSVFATRHDSWSCAPGEAAIPARDRRLVAPEYHDVQQPHQGVVDELWVGRWGGGDFFGKQF